MGAIDEWPAKGRGRTEPHRGRSGASWIWSTPLHTGASEGEFRSGYALTPSPSHSKNISLFTERRTSERTVSEDGYSSFLFNPLWGFPVVAAGILFVVDQVGYISFSVEGVQLLFQVFSARYEKGSLIVTTNLPLAQWTVCSVTPP